jgi:serine phosphatase RsbU (regulator of sigma subunit)/PAS domain-containing protein
MAHHRDEAAAFRYDPCPDTHVTSVPELFGATATALADDTWRIRGWSRGMEQLLGHRTDEVAGRPVDTVLAHPCRTGPAPWHLPAPETPQPVAEESRPASADSRPAAVEDPWSAVVEARHRDGHTLPVAVDAVPLAGQDGTGYWILSAVALTGAANAPAAVGAPLLHALLERSPLAIAVWDTELRCLWLNGTAAPPGSGTRKHSVGRPLREAAALGFDLTAIEPLLRDVLDDGRPVIDHEVRRTLPDGRDRFYSASAFRLDGPDGTPLGLCTLGIDVDDSIARRRLALLSRAGTQIGTSLDIMTTAQELADVAVPVPADFVTVDLVDWLPLGEIPRERPGSTALGMALRRAGWASIHEGVPEAAIPPGETIVQPPSSPIARPLLTGEPDLEPQIDRSFRPDGDATGASTVSEAGLHSAMVVPLQAREAVLGVAVFARTDNPVPFARDDLLLAEELVRRAALSLDNARQYAQERRAALALQRDLLPRRLPSRTHLEVASRYLPAGEQEVGGDWYDLIPLPGNRTALVVGDVVGHGINAAAGMGRLRTAVRALAALDLPPDRVLTHLDDVALQLSEESDEPGPSGVPPLAATCLYVIHDPTARSCTVARAGHPSPAVVTPDGTADYPEIPAGAPIGWGLASYRNSTVPLAEGGLVAMFTDGLIESRRDDIDTGLTRLATALGRADGTLEERCGQVVDAMLRGRAPEDDISVLLARVRGGGGHRAHHAC